MKIIFYESPQNLNNNFGYVSDSSMQYLKFWELSNKDHSHLVKTHFDRKYPTNAYMILNFHLSSTSNRIPLSKFFFFNGIAFGANTKTENLRYNQISYQNTKWSRFCLILIGSLFFLIIIIIHWAYRLYRFILCVIIYL